MELKWKKLDNSNLRGYTAVVPSVAVGNVGQLACDLLISSLRMKKIASINSIAIVPILGYDPYDHNTIDLSMCCELYKCEEKKIIVLQLRAPLVYKYATSFLKQILEKFKESGINDIVILTSSYAHEKKHIMTSPFRYLVNEYSSYKNEIQKLNWTEHEIIENGIKILGGGFASLLYGICIEQLVPCLILYKYCSEGDNIPDAYEMIQYLDSVLRIFNKDKDLSSQLVQPISWKYLYGRPPPIGIY
ncbi:proteasome assembly chaperone 2 [Bombyx mandarina]|uniref:Proteasome assembly chaperone 2 n=1 Tax=Bombyx mandarina TaxID=7092 RepID=A0A6J2JNY3_BOMMA|nr:proteasome assembly chaperone 2 [Bombyx mandarina]